jgi:hypothetical protein
MATRRKPTAADADGPITDETFLQNKISFDAGFTSKLSFEKVESGELSSFIIRRFILSVHELVKTFVWQPTFHGKLNGAYSVLRIRPSA